MSHMQNWVNYTLDNYYQPLANDPETGDQTGCGCFSTIPQAWEEPVRAMCHNRYVFSFSKVMARCILGPLRSYRQFPVGKQHPSQWERNRVRGC